MEVIRPNTRSILLCRPSIRSSLSSYVDLVSRGNISEAGGTISDIEMSGDSWFETTGEISMGEEMGGEPELEPGLDKCRSMLVMRVFWDFISALSCSYSVRASVSCAVSSLTNSIRVSTRAVGRGAGEEFSFCLPLFLGACIELSSD